MRWSDPHRLGATVMYVRCHRLAADSAQSLHGHDFAEIFWCFHGSCRHVLNGAAGTFAVGDAAFLGPGDVHEIRTGPDEECFYYLVCFPAAVLAQLRAAFPDVVQAFWGASAEERIRRLSLRDVARYEREFLDLQRDPDSPLLLQRFLLNLLHDLRRAPQDPLRDCPEWLRRAFHVLAGDPLLLARGGAALVELSGRSREHLARTLRRSAGLTTSEALNRVRIEWAAARLVLSDAAITAIALDCGYESLSHFYAAFRRLMGTTPRAYRRQHQTVTGAH